MKNSKQPFLVDSHCHLNDARYEGDYQSVIKRAKQAGVGAMVTISTSKEEWPVLTEIADSDPHVYCSVGTHPCYFNKSDNIYDLDLLLSRSSHPKCIAVGETGLDYYHSLDHVDAQKKSLLDHIEVSRQTGLPIIIHTRNADDDTRDILVSEYRNGAYPGLIHCFSSNTEFAKAMLDIGFYISMSGIVTYKKSFDIQDAAHYVPLDRLLVETDAPYLSPQPVRAKLNEPAYVTHTAEHVANLKDISLVDVMNATTDNFYRLFNKASRPLVV